MATTPLGRRLPALLRFLISLSLALAVAPLAAAQEAVPKQGDRVRVTVRVPFHMANGIRDKDVRYVGNLVEWDQMSMRWDSAGSFRSAPWDHVTKLEVSQGRRSNTGKGALIGLLSGAVVGVGFAFIGCEGWTENCFDTSSTGDVALLTGALGAAGGAAIGALIGLTSKTDRWSEVPSSIYPGTATQVARHSH